MTEIIQGFDSILEKIEDWRNRDEGVILLLENMLLDDSSKVEKVIKKFQSSNDDDLKEILASLIIKVSSAVEYREYLKDSHDWDDSDFQ